ncbi:MAG: deoxyribose-phosphate aldolase [bacterium]
MSQEPPSRSGLRLPERIDHTLLRPEADEEEVLILLEEAGEWGFAAAVVLPRWVGRAARELEDSSTAVCTVVGFPLAHELPATLERAASAASASGAEEIDMVISTGALRSGLEAEALLEIETVVRAARAEYGDVIVKVIMETHLLDDRALKKGCALVEEAGADFVKTTTGFTGGGATPREVRRLKDLVGERLGVKASAGIRSLEEAEALVEAGADRLGTSSGVVIAREWEKRRMRDAAV